MSIHHLRIDLLQDIKHYIDDEELETSLQQPVDDMPSLTVNLGEDEEKRARTLIITAHELILAGAVLEQPEQEKTGKEPPAATPSSDLVRLQFQYYFPFPVKAGTSSDVGALLFFLNRQSDFPGLELCQEEMRVAYRYVSINPYSAFSKELILGIVGMVHFFTLMFAHSIEKVASAQQTFNEYIEEVLHFQQLHDAGKRS